MSVHDKKKGRLKKAIKTVAKKGKGRIKSYVKGKAVDAVKDFVSDQAKKQRSPGQKRIAKALRRPGADITIGKKFTLGGKKKARQKKKISKWKAEAAAGKKTEQQKFLELNKSYNK